jgi:hypothetical protein
VSETCDLTGTFGMLTELDIEWDAVRVSGITVVQGGSDTLYSWSLRRQTQTGNNISAQSQACGDTAPDLCSPFLGLAVTQKIPDSTYEVSTMPRTASTLTLSKAPVAGDPYVGDTEANLIGLSLANPTGAWPASYTDPAITWRDDDSDGHPGVTALIPTTGNSASCNLPYGGLPIPSDGDTANQVYAGSRSLGNLNGTIIDCDTMRGDIQGPSNGAPQLDGHVTGCVKVDGTACTAAEVDSIDSGLAGAQRVLAARFTLVRVADTTSCTQLRALNFP